MTQARTVELLKDGYFWLIVTAAVFLGTFSYLHDIGKVAWLPPYEEWHLVYMAVERALFLGVVGVAAWRFGVKGGLAACFPLWLIILWSNTILRTEHPEALLELGVILVAGVILSWLVGTRKRMGG